MTVFSASSSKNIYKWFHLLIILDGYGAQDHVEASSTQEFVLTMEHFVFATIPTNSRNRSHRSEFVRSQIISKASYTTCALTNGRILSAVMLPIPSLDEQTAIATILSDMDTSF